MRFRPASSSTPHGNQVTFQDSTNVTPTKERKTPSNFNFKPVGSQPVSLSSPVFRSPPVKRVRKEALSFEYPTNIKKPGRKIVKDFYEAAVTVEDSHQNRLDDADTGLLSLEEVLVPAVARMEIDAVKAVQAKAQRDTPDAVPLLMQCRLFIFAMAGNAVEGAKQARALREAAEQEKIQEQERERQRQKEALQKQKAEERLQRREKRAKQRALEIRNRKQELKKKLPRNMELWREVAFLMTELAKLQKEEKLWKEAERIMEAREADLVQREKASAESQKETADKSVVVEENHDELQSNVDDVVDSIKLSSLRIQSAVDVIKKTMEDSAEVRQELYDKYSKDHIFHGYAGINDTKGLIRFLSQD